MTVALSDLFDIRYGHSLELNHLKRVSQAAGGVPFVSRRMGSNGISAYVAPIQGVEPAAAGQLSCALGGNGVLSTFLQEGPFYSGRDVCHLKPRVKMTKQQLLYYCACIVANRYRYSYGRQANRTLKSILVPSLYEIPGYVAAIDVARFDGCDSSRANERTPALVTDSWQRFRLDGLFELRKGRRLTKANMLPGRTPYVGASDSVNGVTARIGQKPIHEGNTISVSYNGSVAEAFYQPAPYWATDDVNVLYPRFRLTPETGLFLCTVIRLEKFRFNYGRKWHLDRMRESVIRLPATRSGEPDWDFMARYVETLPYSSQIGPR
jgi:Type I restriction modification DNA specificity domain